mmetsp:Transcript_35858/g.83100  ORF Transcript_35858/g.83100 Transcript_35858/m.83100 type:complete len:175 (-) Transcript_35858:28-552(-)
MTKFDEGFGLPLVLHYRAFENMGAPKAGIMLFQSQSPNQSHPLNSQGDAIIITHPTTLMDETRIVTMVLSNVSISISSPFSSDLISTLAFRYVKAPKEKREVVVDEHAKRQKKARDEDAAFGTYGGELGTKFVYRERKRQGTGYLIKTEAMATQRSRGELLDMRAGKKADRMCM